MITVSSRVFYSGLLLLLCKGLLFILLLLTLGCPSGIGTFCGGVFFSTIFWGSVTLFSGTMAGVWDSYPLSFAFCLSSSFTYSSSVSTMTPFLLSFSSSRYFMTTSCSIYWAVVKVFVCGGDFFSSSNIFYFLGAGCSTVLLSSSMTLLPTTPLKAGTLASYTDLNSTFS